MIRYAEESDFDKLKKYDREICETELRNSIKAKKVIVLFAEDLLIGWLRFHLFWDNTPFMNMLYCLEGYRGKGYGRQLVAFWENEMLKNNYKGVCTSTRSDEQAQFFYRKLGYRECGSFIFPNEPLEIVFLKNLV